MFRPFVTIASIASIIFIALGVVARVPTYRWAPLFLVLAIWGVYFLRRRLHLRAGHFALLAGALVLHDLGALGFYQRGFGGISFDVYVHSIFGFAMALAIHRFVSVELRLGRWGLRLATLLSVMGLGALHEIVEYCSYLLLGEEKGMLKPATSYLFDTQRDLTSNLFGCVIALGLIAAVELGVRRRSRRAGRAIEDRVPAR